MQLEHEHSPAPIDGDRVTIIEAVRTPHPAVIPVERLLEAIFLKFTTRHRTSRGLQPNGRIGFVFLLGIALAVFSSLGCSPTTSSTDGSAEQPRFEISERGRLSISASAFGDATKIGLDLELDDGDYEESSRVTRIVSVDGRRLDTRAERIEARPTRFLVQVPAEFLAPGLYMIEVETLERHAIKLRRYTLDVALEAGQ
jgi:hypothetical protein